MEHTLSTGLKLPALGLGTYDIRGKEGGLAIAKAIELGYRHIDTAAVYENEDAVGEGVRLSGADRESLFVTTKIDPSNLGRAAARASCEKSLSAMDLDYVDLLLIHWPNPEIAMEETFSALAELVSEGKARHIGLSNFIRPRVDEAVKASPVKLETNQVEYHPHLKQEKLRAHCAGSAILITAYSPLANGRVLADPVLDEIGKEVGRSVAQIALRWLLQKGIVAIPKAGKESHMRSNLDALRFELDAAQIDRIDAIPTVKRVVDFAPGNFGDDPDVF